MKYKKRKDYEEFTIKYNEQTICLACCDCGLVHEFAFHVYRGQVLGIAARRKERATAQLRRHEFGNLQKQHKRYKLKRV